MFIQISPLLVRLGFYLLVLFQICIFLILQCKPALQKLSTFTHLLNPTVQIILELPQYYTTNKWSSKSLFFLSLDCPVPLRVCNQNILIKITCINSFLLSVWLSIWHIILFLFCIQLQAFSCSCWFYFFFSKIFFFFLMRTILKILIEFVTILILFYVLFCFFFGHGVYGILASRSGIEPIPLDHQGSPLLYFLNI